VARKLEYLRKQLSLLEPYRTVPKTEIMEDLEKRLSVERLLELCIQAAIDCSRLLVIVEDWREARDDRDAFALLAERDVLDPKLAARLSDAKAFRNILVHEYAEIDYELLYKYLRSDTNDLVNFAEMIAKHLHS